MAGDAADDRERRRALLRRLRAVVGDAHGLEELLDKALTHRSALEHGQPRADANEALEFLGDAVLDLVVAQRALELQPEADEGTLSRARAAVVNTAALRQVALDLGLDELIRLGEGEKRSGGAGKASILAGACEALVGALYLSCGLAATAAFVEAQMGERLAELMRRLPLAEVDPKSALQERLQAAGQPLPEYRVVDSSGPDHRPVFRVEIWHRDRLLARAEGESKKQAERRAARRALRGLED